MFRLLLISVVLFFFPPQSKQSIPRNTACSTFMLHGEQSLLVGHNLDEIFHMPGWMVVSPRGVERRDVCLHELLKEECPTPDLQWKARYGSVAFGFGADLADGGMNEAGLTINEMGLVPKGYGFDEKRPTMLTRLWIRYQLDMYATVDEVIGNIDEINIDGNNLYSPLAVTWSHFFIADSSGKKAVIQFTNGRPVIYDDADVDVPVLCNDQYRTERAALSSYWRFGGWKPIFETFLDSYSRFVQGAYLTQEYEEGSPEENAEYAFDILHTMQRSSTRQWSIVYDVRGRRVLFRTIRGPSIRSLRLDQISFDEGAPTLVLADIHENIEGDVFPHLIPYEIGSERPFIAHLIENYAQFCAASLGWDDLDAYLNFEQEGLSLASYVDRAADCANAIRLSR